MDAAEFDKFADEYRAVHASNVRASGEAPEYFAAYKISDVASWYSSATKTGHDFSILDFGGGIGNSVPHFRRYFPDSKLVCLDVSQRCLSLAARQFSGKASFIHFDGARIPFDDDSFDIAFAACVFHHIDASEHLALLTELRRILKPAGRLFIFEHNPINPLTVRAVNTCPFDENAALIRGSAMTRIFKTARFADVSLRYRLFFPRALAALRPLERFMTKIPLGAQYYVVGSKP